MLSTEQLIAAHKAQVEALIGLSHKALQGAEKFTQLHLQAARASFEDAAEFARATTQAKDAQTLLNVQAGYLQPSAEKAAAYARSVYEVASELQGEFAELIEVQAGDAQAKVKALVQAAVKNAPAGSENAVSLLSNGFTAANQAYEQAQRAAKEATETVQANVRQFSSAIGKAKAPTTKARR
jgi:phasin family protein